jgi:hypothetical protein
MKNFIKAGIILFSLTTQLEASLVSNDLVLDNASAMTQLEAKHASSNPVLLYVLDNYVLDNHAPALWTNVYRLVGAVAIEIASVPLIVFGSKDLLPLSLKSVSLEKKIGVASVSIGVVQVLLGLAIASYAIKRIVYYHKVKKTLKVIEGRAAEKTQLVTYPHPIVATSVTHA